ncbi:hypothetical protein MIMGU_mgv1a024005mg, partial [Erythranthe guttata]
MYILLLKCFYYWIIIQYFVQITTSSNDDDNPKPCVPSSCGEIRNISYPFRLNTDPKRCGHPKYELSCENNTTSLYLNSHKYLVQVINYHNYTIRLTDASIQNDSCSFPNHSLSGSDFGNFGSTYSIKRYDRYFSLHGITWPITFISCPYPVNKNDKHSFNESNSRHKYIKFGPLNGSSMMDLCRIDLIVMTSLNLTYNNEGFVLSDLSQVHRCLIYGFELSWFIVLCRDHCLDCV